MTASSATPSATSSAGRLCVKLSGEYQSLISFYAAPVTQSEEGGGGEECFFFAVILAKGEEEEYLSPSASKFPKCAMESTPKEASILHIIIIIFDSQYLRQSEFCAPENCTVEEDLLMCILGALPHGDR